MSNFPIMNCLCCGSENLRLTLDLEEQPLANDFREKGAPASPTYPLALMTCRDCWHSQLSYCVSRKTIFDNYTYASGTSNTLRSFFQWFAGCMSKFFAKGTKVLDIAANDGSFVAALLENNFEAVGIDPAENMVVTAQAKGLPLVHGYWPQDALKAGGPFDVIVCMNVLAHVENPKEFLKACVSSLKPGGVVLVQPSQARMFGNFEFDTCYHEHLSFFNSNSIAILARTVGLDLLSSFLVGIHGDSPVYVLGRMGDKLTVDIRESFSKGEFSIKENLNDYERSIELFTDRTYDEFAINSEHIIRSLAQKVANHRKDGYDVVFLGAAAKAMTVINAAGVKPDLFLDEAELKIGKFAPGVGVQVKSLSALADIRRPIFLVITAWNFKAELLEKIRKYEVPQGSKYYCYFPHEEIGGL